MIGIDLVMKLLECFPRSYMNQFGEVILKEKGNVYFTIKHCENELDIKKKLLEWFSRPASKGMPYSAEWRNRKFRAFMLDGVNQFLHTDFSENDIAIIYQELGNAINHSKTIEFVRSGYNMNLLTESEE